MTKKHGCRHKRDDPHESDMPDFAIKFAAKLHAIAVEGAPRGGNAPVMVMRRPNACGHGYLDQEILVVCDKHFTHIQTYIQPHCPWHIEKQELGTWYVAAKMHKVPMQRLDTAWGGEHEDRFGRHPTLTDLLGDDSCSEEWVEDTPYEEDRLLAVMMSHQHRLGAESPLRMLDVYMLVNMLQGDNVKYRWSNQSVRGLVMNRGIVSVFGGMP